MPSKAIRRLPQNPSKPASLRVFCSVLALHIPQQSARMCAQMCAHDEKRCAHGSVLVCPWQIGVPKLMAIFHGHTLASKPCLVVFSGAFSNFLTGGKYRGTREVFRNHGHTAYGWGKEWRYRIPSCAT